MSRIFQYFDFHKIENLKPRHHLIGMMKIGYNVISRVFRTVSVISGEGVPETISLTRGIFGGCNGLSKVIKHSIFDHIFIIKEA